MTGETAGPFSLWCRCSVARLAPALALSLVGLLVVTLAPALTTVLTARLAHAASGSESYRVPGSRTFHLSGLGYGHGIGMSQFGAEGMGRLGKTYRQIMKFYFPGTNFATVSASREITVGLSGVVQSTPQGNAVVVVDRSDLSASNRGNSIDLPRRAGGAQVKSYRVVRRSSGLAIYAVSSAKVVKVKGGISGAVTWRTAGALSDSKVAVGTAGGGTRLYRGYLEVKKGSSVLAISRVLLQDYLRSVVSHEVPSSWTAAALRAQAVAARSYALTSQASARAANRPYDICDTTYCQAYGPIGYESRAEVRAVNATRGVYLRSAGQPVLAMFSSANGGYSVAGGRPYLVAQPDPYDGVVTGDANWGHKWSTSVKASAIERSWPQIGRLQKIKVLGRDGNGQWNGRVLSVGLVGGKGRVTVSADSFRWAVGLKSTWWTITNADGSARAPAKNVRVERADRSGIVRWGTPDTDRPVVGYRVTVSRTDTVYRVGRAARKVLVKGLTNGREYRAHVAPVYKSGPGPKTATPAFVPSSPFSYFQPLTARRVIDRKDVPAVDRSEPVSTSVVGDGRAPASGTRAVAVRVMAESMRKPGRVKVWPCGAADRSQVALTYRAEDVSAGLVTVPVRSNGRLCVGAGTALASLKVDLLGYFTASGVGTKSLRAVAARRVVNSQTGKGWTGGRLQAGDPAQVKIAGREGVPAEARTVLLSLGLVKPTENALLSVAPPGTPVSLGAAVRARQGSWRTGTIVARLDDRGRLPLRLTNGRAHVHVDVLGWFRPQGGEGAGRYRSTKGKTVLDSSHALAAGSPAAIRVRGGDTGVPGGASAVVIQALADGQDDGYLTLRPAGSQQTQRPLLSFDRRGTQRTLVVVPVGDEGQISVTAKGADAAVSLRVVGWYS
ncbi:MAG TPA: SpoIID/LytB domain-containing protein [Actinomycetes bacterium]|nr:SpoIID/LytB domain-containing protein [Actinomycetes bacterium]